MISNEDQAGRAALAWVNEVVWKDGWLEPAVQAVEDCGEFWRVFCVRQQVVVSDGSLHQFDKTLLVEKATGWVGISNPSFPKPGHGSWDEVTAAWRRFRDEVLRFQRRPDADDILRSHALSPLVGEIVLGHPHGWKTRDDLAPQLVTCAVAGRDTYLRRARELLHLLPQDIVESAVSEAIGLWDGLTDPDEREYQLGTLTTLCAELVLAEQLDRLIDLAGGDHGLSEALEDSVAIRYDRRWGNRYSTWTHQDP